MVRPRGKDKIQYTHHAKLNCWYLVIVSPLERMPDHWHPLGANDFIILVDVSSAVVSWSNTCEPLLKAVAHPSFYFLSQSARPPLFSFHSPNWP